MAHAGIGVSCAFGSSVMSFATKDGTRSRYAGGRIEVSRICDTLCRVGKIRSGSNGEDDIARDSDVSSHDARF